MATDLKSPQQSPRHEQFVERQLARATRRIHALDVGRTALWLLAATLSFALAMAVLDLTLGRPDSAWAVAIHWARLGFWGIYVGVAAVLAGALVVRLFRRINPYYAARQIEQSLPNAKNSVVNWLDLREEKLPPAVKTALGLRAAHDLKDADPEQVTAGKHSWLLMVFTLLLLTGLAVLLVKSGPGQFASLMQRAFLPIDRAPVVSPTEITLTHPAKGDAVVAPRQSIVFRATINGVVPRADTPQAPRLQYRYQDKDAWATLPLVQDLDGSWTLTMPADLVQNGFFYKLSAADAETPSYEVKVVSLPQAKKFDVKYHFQPYLRLPDIAIVAASPRIKAHRGTEVTLVIHANHPLREGSVELHPDGEPAQSIPGEISPDDPNAYRVKFLLEKSGSLRVLFTSSAGEENSDRLPHPVLVLADLGPSVVLTKPGKDVSLPANGILQLEGAATDDFGVKNLTLRLKIDHGQDDLDLASKPYRPGASLQFADGSFPNDLDYKDFVALDQLKSARGQLVPLAKGTVLAYWLEAIDNSEFPSKTGNVGKSKVYRVTIADPQDQKKQQEERKQAGQEQQRHEKDQDQDLKQQEQDRKDNRQRTPQERREERDLNQKKERLQQEIKKQQQGESKGNEGNDSPAEKTTAKDVDDLNKKLKQNGPEASNAAEKLEQAAEKAKDPKVREAAEKALKDNGLDLQPPAKDLTPKDVDDQKEKMKQKGPQGEAAERKLSKAADQAKDPKAREAAKKALEDAIKNLSEKDIENLKEKLKQKGPQADRAEEKLSKAAEGAKNEKAREAAKNALKEAIKNLSEKDIEKLKEKLKQNGPQANGAEDKLSKAADQAKDQKAREAAKDALKDAIKNLTEKDIEKLKEKLNGPQGEAAEDKIAKAAEQAKDPKARDAAEKAFKDLVKNLNEKDIKDLADKLKQGGAKADAAEKKLGKAAEASKDEKTREAADKALKDAIKNLTEKDVEKLKEKLNKSGAEADAAEKKLGKAAEQAEDQKAREAAGQALRDDRQGKERTQKEVDKSALKQEGVDKNGKETDAQKAEKLKEMLDKKGLLGEVAAKELDKLAKQTKDPQVKKDIEDALKKAPPGKGERTPDDVEFLKHLLEQKGPLADFAKQELTKIADRSKDPKVQKLAEETRNSRDAAISTRGGDLQLEKVTPEILKKAGISEKEWQQIQKHEAARRAQQEATGKDDPLTRKGDPSRLPSVGPQPLDPSANPTLTPTQSGRGQPPPGFRELYQRWTTRPPAPPENK